MYFLTNPSFQLLEDFLFSETVYKNSFLLAKTLLFLMETHFLASV